MVSRTSLGGVFTNGKEDKKPIDELLLIQHLFFLSLGYQSFMLSLKSQISVLDNFVIREESISPVLAMMSKETLETSQNTSDGSIKEVNEIFQRSI